MKVTIKPGWLDAFALWLGADHYSIRSALRQKEFHLPLDAVSDVYAVETSFGIC